jgi:hypothetical protein
MSVYMHYDRFELDIRHIDMFGEFCNTSIIRLWLEIELSFSKYGDSVGESQQSILHRLVPWR